MKLFAFSFILMLGIIFTGCSKKSDVDYMDVASKSIKQNNITKAVESYQILIKDYPHSKEAPDAMFRLATLYQNKLVKNISEKESLEKAVSLFDELNTKYPASKIAPKALFMSGFVLANDIHDFNRATAVFKKFLRYYPNNALTNSAREELSNMGMTPAEILEKKQASKI